eukprot:251400_1
MTDEVNNVNQDYYAWSWKNSKIDHLEVKDLQQLLKTRNVIHNDVQDTKSTMMQKLKRNSNVYLGQRKISNLTENQLFTEYKLNGLQFRMFRLKVLQDRLKKAMQNKIPQFRPLESNNIPEQFSTPMRATHDTLIVIYDGIYSYKLSTNQWTKIVEAPNDANSLANGIWDYFEQAASATDNKYIYIYRYFHKKLIKVNLQNMNINVSDFDFNITSDLYGRSIQMISVEKHDQLHLMTNGTQWRRSSTKHLIYFQNENKFTQVRSYPKTVSTLHAVLHSSRRNKIFAIGKRSDLSNHIKLHCYCVLTNVWTLVDVELPEKKVGAVITNCENYIILYSNDYGACNNTKQLIWTVDITDLLNVRVKESMVKCPTTRVMKGIIMRNILEEELIVFGFMR